MNPRHIAYLIRKDLLLEWRQKYALNGIILYVFSTLFIIKISFGAVQPGSWITLFWITILFTAVNAGAKSFIQEGRSRQMYYYVLSAPENIILAKFLYNSMLFTLLGFLTMAGFVFFFGNIIGNVPYFMLVLLLGATGFAAVFTMISGIAAKARGSATLMSILSFPVILPQLLLILRLSRRAADGFELMSGERHLVALLAINVTIIIVSYLLFPYLWRD
jgi:heme exporter protein B